MKQAFICGFFILSGLCGHHAGAQENTDTKRWTLADCLKFADEHNVQISTLRLNEQSAEQDLQAAKGAKLPSLSATVGNVFNHGNNNVPGNGGLVNQVTSTGTYAVNSSVVLWNDNLINNTIQQRQLLIQSANLFVQQALNNLTLLITQDYLSVLLAKENLNYITDLVNTSEARVRQGEIFYKAGSIAKKDLLQLQAQLASDRYLLVQTQNNIRQSLLLLKQNLQLPAEAPFDIATPDTVVVNKTLLPFYKVQQAALQAFPDSRIGKLGVDIAALDIARAAAGFKPTLFATGAMGSGYTDALTNPVSAKTGYFSQTGDNFYQRVGLSLSIPIFSNYSNKTNRAKAVIAYKAAELNWQNDQLLLSQAVEQAYLSASNAVQAFDAASEQLTAAAESFRISNAQFRLGAINSYDLLQQRNQYVQAVQAFTQAKYSAVLQQKIYEFYLGKPVTL